MCSLEQAKTSFAVVFKPRPDGSRSLIILLVLLFGLYFLVGLGPMNIMTPYIKMEFPWGDEVKLNNWLATYSTVGTVLQTIAIGLLLPLFSQIFKWSDMTITLLSLVSMLGGLIITLMAKVSWVLYISALVQMFSMMTTTVLRSALTKLVSSEDTGKVCIDCYVAVNPSRSSKAFLVIPDFCCLWLNGCNCWFAKSGG